MSRRWPCYARKRRKTGLKSIATWFWKDVGCREDSSTLVGEMKVSAKHVTRRKAQRSTGSTTAQNGTRSDGEAFRKWEQKARKPQKEWRWQRGIVSHPLSESQWNRDHFSLKKWESEKHKSWKMHRTKVLVKIFRKW